MSHQLVLVLDFGSQVTQLIARRVREQAVYCEIHPFHLSLDAIKKLAPAAIILSGGPSSVYAEGAPAIDPALFGLGVPVLGICYGAQLIARLCGGDVRPADKREFGRATVTVTQGGAGAFRAMAAGDELTVW